MRNTITFRDAAGEPQPGLAVELYNWQSTSPFYSTKVGDFTDAANGQYYIDLTNSIRGTILVDSVVQTALIGILMNGDLGTTSIPDGSITTAKLADGAVTPPKTSFAENY